MAFNGALVKKVANQTTANYTTLTAVAWDTEVYDTNSWHDNATNNTRVTVPSSVNKVRLTAGFFADLISGADRIRLHIYKNGAVLTPGTKFEQQITFTQWGVACVSPVYEVVVGDYFELMVSVSGDTSISVFAVASWLSVEAIDGVPPTYSGAVVKKAADQTAANYVGGVLVAWDSEVHDVGGWHDNVTNNTRLTVPSGVSRVRLKAQMLTTLTTSSDIRLLALRKNGAAITPDISPWFVMNNATTNSQVVSPVLDVTPGDYFELSFLVNTDTSVTVVATQSWFAIEKVE